MPSESHWLGTISCMQLSYYKYFSKCPQNFVFKKDTYIYIHQNSDDELWQISFLASNFPFPIEMTKIPSNEYHLVQVLKKNDCHLHSAAECRWQSFCTQQSTAMTLAYFSKYIGNEEGILTRHRLGYWRTLECLGGGLSRPAPLPSREPLVVERRARRHSKALHNTHPKHLSELKIKVTCEIKVRSKVKIWCFDVLGPGDKDYRTWWLKLRQNVVIGMVKVWYKPHTKKTSRSRSGHNRSLYVRNVIKSCDQCFMAQFRRRTRNSRLKYHLT